MIETPAPERTSLLSRFAGWSQRHSWFALAAWLVVVVGLAVSAGALGGTFDDDFTLPGSESQRVADALADSDRGPARDEVTIVVHRDDGLTDAASTAAVRGMLADLADAGPVSEVTDPYRDPGSLSPDRRTLTATVTLDTAPGDTAP